MVVGVVDIVHRPEDLLHHQDHLHHSPAAAAEVLVDSLFTHFQDLAAVGLGFLD
jgi:hypothetical protein